MNAVLHSSIRYAFYWYKVSFCAPLSRVLYRYFVMYDVYIRTRNSCAHGYDILHTTRYFRKFYTTSIPYPILVWVPSRHPHPYPTLLWVMHENNTRPGTSECSVRPWNNTGVRVHLIPVLDTLVRSVQHPYPTGYFCEFCKKSIPVPDISVSFVISYTLPVKHKPHRTQP